METLIESTAAPLQNNVTFLMCFLVLYPWDDATVTCTSLLFVLLFFVPCLIPSAELFLSAPCCASRSCFCSLQFQRIIIFFASPKSLVLEVESIPILRIISSRAFFAVCLFFVKEEKKKSTAMPTCTFYKFIFMTKSRSFILTS